LKTEYYTIRVGCSYGTPTRETLESLGMKEVADELEKRGWRGALCSRRDPILVEVAVG